MAKVRPSRVEAEKIADELREDIIEVLMRGGIGEIKAEMRGGEVFGTLVEQNRTLIGEVRIR